MLLALPEEECTSQSGQGSCCTVNGEGRERLHESCNTRDVLACRQRISCSCRLDWQQQMPCWRMHSSWQEAPAALRRTLCSRTSMSISMLSCMMLMRLCPRVRHLSRSVADPHPRTYEKETWQSPEQTWAMLFACSIHNCLGVQPVMTAASCSIPLDGLALMYSCSLSESKLTPEKIY